MNTRKSGKASGHATFLYNSSGGLPRVTGRMNVYTGGCERQPAPETGDGMEQAGAGETRVTGAHAGVSFAGEEILLDGGAFRDCSFERCHLHYDGGALPVLTGCRFSDCAWFFGDAAADTLAMLAALNQGGFSAMVERTLDGVRSGAVLNRAPPGTRPAGRRGRAIDLGFGQFPVPRVLRRAIPAGVAPAGPEQAPEQATVTTDRKENSE